VEAAGTVAMTTPQPLHRATAMREDFSWAAFLQASFQLWVASQLILGV